MVGRRTPETRLIGLTSPAFAGKSVPTSRVVSLGAKSGHTFKVSSAMLGESEKIIEQSKPNNEISMFFGLSMLRLIVGIAVLLLDRN